MFLDNGLEPARKTFIGFGLGFQHFARKDHMVLVAFQHVSHLIIGCSADPGHCGLGFLVGLHADLVDAVGDILLLGCLQRLGQRIIEYHALFRVRLQLVDQHHLRRRLVLKAVDPGFSFFDIPLQGLRFGQLDLFVLNQRIIRGIYLSQFSFKRSPGCRVLFDTDLVFQFDDFGVHRNDLCFDRLQLADSRFALVQRLRQVHFDLVFLLIQQVQLALKKVHDDVGLGDQILQLVIDRRGLHSLLPHRF